MLLHRQLRVNVHAEVADNRYWLDYAPTDRIVLSHLGTLRSCAKPQHFRFAGVELEALRRTPAADIVNAGLDAGHNRTSLGRFTMLETLHIVRVQVEA